MPLKQVPPTRSEVYNALLSNGWQADAAMFAALHRDHPKGGAVIQKLVRRIQTKPWKPEIKKKPLPQSVRIIVFERDNYLCRHCGTDENLTVDHIIPASKGGSDDLTNLQTLCRSCNSKKGNRVAG